MGIFRKIGGAIKNFATNAYDKVKRGVQTVAPKLLQIGSTGLGILSKVPGTVGQISQAAKAGTDALNTIVGNVPNEGAKNKLNKILDKGTNIVDKAGAAVNRVADKATPAIQTGMNTVNTVNNIVNK
jgi:hypothetical protein